MWLLILIFGSFVLFTWHKKINAGIDSASLVRDRLKELGYGEVRVGQVRWRPWVNWMGGRLGSSTMSVNFSVDAKTPEGRLVEMDVIYDSWSWSGSGRVSVLAVRDGEVSDPDRS